MLSLFQYNVCKMEHNDYYFFLNDVSLLDMWDSHGGSYVDY